MTAYVEGAADNATLRDRVPFMGHLGFDAAGMGIAVASEVR